MLSWLPPAPALTRVSVPAGRFQANTSSTPLVSPDTRLEAREPNTTMLPAALIDGLALVSFPATLPTPFACLGRASTAGEAGAPEAPDVFAAGLTIDAAGVVTAVGVGLFPHCESMMDK